jgi:hypothetical protein
VIGVEIVCSDEGCAVTAEVVVDSIDELALLVCDDCGCVAQPLATWDVVELRPAAPVTALPQRRRPPLAA